jgi:hypothetical protein
MPASCARPLISTLLMELPAGVWASVSVGSAHGSSKVSATAGLASRWEDLDQSVAGHNPVGFQREDTENESLLASGQANVVTQVPDLNWTEDPNLHRANLLSLASGRWQPWPQID